MLVIRKIDCIKYSRTRTSEIRYKTYKNKLTSILRAAEKQYYSRILADAKGDTKSTWRILNAVNNNKIGTNELPSQFECKQSIADEFNNFFVSVGPNLAKNITVIDGAASIYDYMGYQNRNSMFVHPVTEIEIINVVKCCKPKNSKDCNDISMYVVKKVINEIAKPLSHVFNLSFSSGVFPSDMKIAMVIPLFKNGTKSDFSNYRPISLLSQF